MSVKPPRYKPVDLPAPCAAELCPVLPASLSAQELCDLAIFVFGCDGWKSPLARALNVSLSTAKRWARGESPIDGPAIAALYLLAGRHPLQTGSTAPARQLHYPQRAERKPKPKRGPRERVAPADKPAPQAERYLLK